MFTNKSDNDQRALIWRFIINSYLDKQLRKQLTPITSYLSFKLAILDREGTTKMESNIIVWYNIVMIKYTVITLIHFVIKQVVDMTHFSVLILYIQDTIFYIKR